MSTKYGPGPYGDGAYSATGPTDYAALAASWPLPITLAANLQKAPIDELAGVLAIQPGLMADLTSSGIDLDGVLVVQPGFGGPLSLQQSMAAQFPLGVSVAMASLASQAALGGAWTVAVAIEAPNDLDVYVGPLWASDAPCQSQPWGADAECPDPGWQPEIGYTPSGYGVGGYGANLFSRGYYGSSPPPWTPSEPCDA